MTYQQNNPNTGLGWDDVITADAKDFVLLEPGEYNFTVVSMERDYHNGSAKLPPCNKAVISVVIQDPGSGDQVTLKSNLFLAKQTEGIISQFFASIGLKKKGQPLKMDWNAIIGKQGKCLVAHRTHEGNTYNDLKRFLVPDDYDQPSAAPAYKRGGY